MAKFMSITKKVDSYVRHQHFGKVFTLEQLIKRSKLEENKNAVTTALRRLVREGQVLRLSPGVYYRPKKSKFGHLPVDTKDLVDSISKHRKATYVVSGAAAVNALGLSTQLPMSRSYIISERIRLNFTSVNVKLEYSKRLAKFAEHLHVDDKEQRQRALLIWSALAYIDRSKIHEYREEMRDCFHKLLNPLTQVKFLKALPPSMTWARKELRTQTH